MSCGLSRLVMDNHYCHQGCNPFPRQQPNGNGRNVEPTTVHPSNHVTRVVTRRHSSPPKLGVATVSHGGHSPQTSRFHSFSRVPPELRCMIYKHYFVEHFYIVCEAGPGTISLTLKCPQSLHLSDGLTAPVYEYDCAAELLLQVVAPQFYETEYFGRTTAGNEAMYQVLPAQETAACVLTWLLSKPLIKANKQIREEVLRFFFKNNKFVYVKSSHLDGCMKDMLHQSGYCGLDRFFSKFHSAVAFMTKLEIIIPRAEDAVEDCYVMLQTLEKAGFRGELNIRAAPARNMSLPGLVGRGTLDDLKTKLPVPAGPREMKPTIYGYMWAGVDLVLHKSCATVDFSQRGGIAGFAGAYERGLAAGIGGLQIRET
ncbi:hypothetical protein LTR66_011374 [Elasticomyces elasticus]|nr:hypothetical protein LTR66_011374 [Elasticomyces elasticus]